MRAGFFYCHFLEYKKAPNQSLRLFEYGGGPSTELKPVTIMQQGFQILQFDLYQQKYQQYAKVPYDFGMIFNFR